MISESTKLLIKAAESITEELSTASSNIELVRASGLDDEAWRALSYSSVLTILANRDLTLEEIDEETTQMLFDALLTGLAIGVRYERELNNDIESLFQDF